MTVKGFILQAPAATGTGWKQKTGKFFIVRVDVSHCECNP